MVTHAHRSRLTVIVLLTLIVFPISACGGNQVDKPLRGTWALQWPGQPIFWEIKKNGTYTVSGPGAVAGHTGSLRASKGKWSLKSDTWGKDGGTYTLTNADTMLCIGKLGPGTWVRVPDQLAKQTADNTKSFSTQQDGARLLAKDLPEFMHETSRQARLWKKDAIPVSIAYQHQKNWNYTGPEIKISYYSPGEGTGILFTATTQNVTPHVFDQSVNWGDDALPPVFVDLPAALRIARERGLKGPLERASLR
ncbi:MAG: hypothetical protein K8I00_07455, partial [Candidatus Omnitrophica bacterium]|nr:hypothetical protein [Candidatus Omnitrophota bacterium]